MMQRLIDLLTRCYEYDVAVFSEPWMYYPLLIPALMYFAFFLLKWYVLTTPVWLPLYIIATAFRNTSTNA